MSDTPTRTRSQIKEDVKADIMRAILDNIRINDSSTSPIGSNSNSPHNLERRVQARRVMEFLGFSSFPGMED